MAKKEDIYPESTTLTTILNDIKKEYYIKNQKDSIYLTRLNTILIEHEEVNPFDKLESNQKFMFENVRQKLDSHYVTVKEDLNRIADEMNNKNLLVDKYLDKSNLSYWLSIIALTLTVILSTIQIYQNSSKDKEKIETRNKQSFFAKLFSDKKDSSEDVKSEGVL